MIAGNAPGDEGFTEDTNLGYLILANKDGSFVLSYFISLVTVSSFFPIILAIRS